MGALTVKNETEYLVVNSKADDDAGITHIFLIWTKTVYRTRNTIKHRTKLKNTRIPLTNYNTYRTSDGGIGVVLTI